MGWDVENKQGYAPAYRDVIFEDSIKVGGETKAPDYCFQIGGVRKFFVEARTTQERIAIGRQSAATSQKGRNEALDAIQTEG